MTTHRTRALCAALAALGLALALPACGGDGDDDAAATTPTTTAPAAADERLDQASWDTYVEARASAHAVNEKAIATFRSCRKLLGTSVEAEKVQECLGTSASDVVTEGQKLLGVLDGLSGEVGGACEAALTQLHGNVKLYISSVNAIALTVERSTLPTTQDIGSSLALLEKSQAAADDFEAACKPE